MTTELAAPRGCCPQSLGTVCWDDSADSGTAFVIFDGEAGELSYLDTLTGNEIDSADIVGCPGAGPVIEREATINVITATGPGATVAGLAGVTITNVGASSGVVLGQPIHAGQTMTWNAYYDEFAREFVRVPAIAYDGAGTTLSIHTQD